MDIAILLVARKDDPACENKVEDVLGRCNYEVFRKKTVEEALQAVEEKQAQLDLVITNFQNLEPVGHEIIHNIQQTLNLSILTMASDERIKQNRELQLTFSLYIVENLSMDYLNILLGNSKGSSNISKSVVETSGASSSMITNKGKKPRFTWTPQMKKKFQDAIQFLGNENAVPKKILQYMGVPGLTRDSISSYLQTYRMSKKCSELATSTYARAPSPYYNPSENISSPIIPPPVYDISSLPVQEGPQNYFFEQTMPDDNILFPNPPSPMWPQNSQNFDQGDWFSYYYNY